MKIRERLLSSSQGNPPALAGGTRFSWSFLGTPQAIAMGWWRNLFPWSSFFSVHALLSACSAQSEAVEGGDGRRQNFDLDDRRQDVGVTGGSWPSWPCLEENLILPTVQDQLGEHDSFELCLTWPRPCSCFILASFCSFVQLECTEGLVLISSCHVTSNTLSAQQSEMVLWTLVMGDNVPSLSKAIQWLPIALTKKCRICNLTYEGQGGLNAADFSTHLQLCLQPLPASSWQAGHFGSSVH